MSPRCLCPICEFSTAHDAAGRAMDAMVEQSTDLEGNYYFLLDEVRAAIETPAPLRRRRLVRALRAVAR